MNEAVKMARIAGEDGIHTIVATPHIRLPYLTPDKIAHTRSLLQEQLDFENIPIKLLSGGDVDALADPNLLKHYTINNTPYILVEFPHSHWPAQAAQILFNMTSQGLYPIVTHPERNPGIVRKPNQLLALLDANIKVQITAGSLTGEFGSDSEACARFLLKKKGVHFLATDAHSPHYRRPVLSEGLKVAEKILGKKEALKMVADNPAAVIAGKPLDGA